MAETDHLFYLKLSAQQALLGQIPPEIRRIDVSLNGQMIKIICIVDGIITEDLKELMEEAATEIIADYPEEFDIDVQYQRSDAPNRAPPTGGSPVYERYERNSRP